MLDSVYRENPKALGILIHVEAPDQGLSWTAASGFAEKSASAPLRIDQPVLIASNTKPYVATAILRLVEEGVLQLNMSIGPLLTPETRDLLETDDYDLSSITIRHLLSHTSGIHDYVDDAYFDLVIARPKHQWGKEAQIQRSLDVGDPLWTPGHSFSYGDINYILLAEILETQTKEPFYAAMRRLLKLKALGLKNTWFETLEPRPEGLAAFAHQYARNFQWDSYELNPSWDLYGGGGLAATVKDGALFFQHLFEGHIVKDAELLRTMSEYVLPSETSKYCLGVYHFDFGYPLYYHGGWWGTDVNYSPETNASIAVYTLVKEQRGVVNPFLGKEIQRLLSEALNE